MMNETPELYRRLARAQRDEAAQLERRYPGTRPGWVSTDVAIALRLADEYEAEARRLEARQGAAA